MSTTLSQPLSSSAMQMTAQLGKRHYLDSDALGQSMNVLYGLLRRSYLTYYPSLAKLAGSPKAGLMLGHALYYSKQLEQSQPERDGWFYMGGLDWFKGTGLSVREQDAARLQLCTDTESRAPFLQVERLGMPARLWYRVKLNSICQALNIDLSEEDGSTNESASPASLGVLDGSSLKVLLGRVVVFYADLAHLANSASAGIYLSQLLNEYQFRASRQQLDGQAFAVAQDASVWQALFLGEKTVRNAREQAQAAGWVTFKRANRRCGDLQYRVNIEALCAAMSRFDLTAHCTQQVAFALSAEQVPRKGQKKKSSERQMQFTYAQNAEQVLRKGQEQMLNNGQNLVGSALFVEQGFALFADQVPRKGQNPIRVVKNSNNLQQEVVEKNTAAPKIEHPLPQQKIGGGFLSNLQKPQTVSIVDLTQLHIPSVILEAEYPTLQTLLSKSKNPQLILDELLGQSKFRTIESPCAYIRSLINKETTGDLIFAHAHRIQAKRLASQQIAHAVAISHDEEQTSKTQTPESLAQQAKETEAGHALLAKLRAQWSRKEAGAEALNQALEVTV